MANDRFREWVDRNPLRAWRRKNGVAIMDAASQMGVSMTIIQLWEKGVHVPSADNFDRLEALVGSTVARDWSKWFNAKPQMLGAGSKGG